MGGRAGGHGATVGPDIGPSGHTRRTWLKVGAWGLLAGPLSSLRAQATKKAPLTPDDEKSVAAVRDKARKAGLGAFDPKSNGHFLGVGDGPPRYSAEAIDRCESIARDYLTHFQRLGFKVDFPARRLTVVTLKDSASYGAFSGEDPGQSIGGHYEPDANWLVIFDFRADQAKQNAEAKRYNTFTLVHETIHLLCFNTGLLSRRDDVPACISEGLATYGELWTPTRSSAGFGAVNRPRLLGLIQEMEQGAQWIPVSRLLTDDKLFDDPRTYHVAYGESWLLVHFLLDNPEWLPKFRAYLAGMPKVDDGRKPSRDKYAESRLGSLRELDQAVQRHAQAVAKKARPRLPAVVIRGRG
jgi:hypothetical protein